MVVSEVFYSIQGEGFLAGMPSVFVRLSGCPLRCRWCDTQYAWDKESGTECSIDEILKAVGQWPCKFVTITGGEPMNNQVLPELAKRIKAFDKHITIETSGIIFVPDLTCDVMSISPKLSNSRPRAPGPASLHENSRLDISVLRQLVGAYNYQVKFVVEDKDDLAEIEVVLRSVPNIDRQKVMLMPQAATREELLAKSPMIVEMCKHTGFAFSQRLQILLWNNKRGK